MNVGEMMYEGDNKEFFMGLSKEQRQRKSTPIRGENEKFKINIDKVTYYCYVCYRSKMTAAQQ